MFISQYAIRGTFIWVPGRYVPQIPSSLWFILLINIMFFATKWTNGLPVVTQRWNDLSCTFHQRRLNRPDCKALLPNSLEKKQHLWTTNPVTASQARSIFSLHPQLCLILVLPPDTIKWDHFYMPCWTQLVKVKACAGVNKSKYAFKISAIFSPLLKSKVPGEWQNLGSETSERGRYW